MSPSPPSDAELLHRVATQDRDAYRLLWGRHAGRLLALLELLSRDPHRAEDALHDTFLMVWNRAASYSVDQGDVSSWLFVVARDALVSRRRAEAEGGDPSRHTTSTEGSDLRMLVDDILATLEPEQRRAVRMTYLSGHSYEETAARLTVPVDTLRERIRGALRRLRGAS